MSLGRGRRSLAHVSRVMSNALSSRVIFGTRLIGSLPRTASYGRRWPSASRAVDQQPHNLIKLHDLQIRVDPDGVVRGGADALLEQHPVAPEQADHLLSQ